MAKKSFFDVALPEQLSAKSLTIAETFDKCDSGIADQKVNHAEFSKFQHHKKQNECQDGQQVEQSRFSFSKN